MNVSSFSSDEAVFDAVLFNLKVIGEAVKNLPESRSERVVDGELFGSGQTARLDRSSLLRN